MENVIKKSCEDLLSIYTKRETKDDILKKCARKKLINIYNKENNEFTELVNKLEASINYNDYTSVKKCVTRLMKLLGHNRKFLMECLERLCE